MRKYIATRILLLFVFLIPVNAQDALQDMDLPVAPPTKFPAGDPRNDALPPVEPPPPEEPAYFSGEPIPSENRTIVYVVDISGSMGAAFGFTWIGVDGNVTTGSRLDRAKSEMKKSINSLPEDYRFNIYKYHCTTARWSQDLRTATPQNKASAFSYIDSMNAAGGTGTGECMTLVLGDKSVKSVILLTDGAPGCFSPPVGMTMTEYHRHMIRVSNTQEAKVNVFGIRVYSSTRTFCQDVSRENGGFYREISD